MAAALSRLTLSRLLTLVALAAMLGAWFGPIWWVSLTAPNYPKDAFPDGIRIHFHFDGVRNGCHAAGAGTRMAKEILQEDMSESTGRYNPILEEERKAKGQAAASAETASALDCVHEMNTINHYVGMYPIATGSPVELRLSKFIFGFFAVMLLGFLAPERRVQLMILAPGFLAVSAWMIVDQFVQGGRDAFAEHYFREASAFFNQPETLLRWVANLKAVTSAAIVGLIAAMILVLVGVWRSRPFTLLLALVPALLPVFFVADYAGWLWFFGHHLHPWGAFTVKPFMPTVFGEGKVAQFSTFSYPHWGFALLMLASVALVPAALLRRQDLRAGDAEHAGPGAAPGP
jgi:hypothetical protein